MNLFLEFQAKKIVGKPGRTIYIDRKTESLRQKDDTLEVLSWKTTRWKHLAGKFCPTRLTHQTWLLPITTCLNRWVTHLLSSASVRMKKGKNGSMNCSQQKGRFLPAWYSQIAREIGKMYNTRWSITYFE